MAVEILSPWSSTRSFRTKVRELQMLEIGRLAAVASENVDYFGDKVSISDNSESVAVNSAYLGSSSASVGTWLYSKVNGSFVLKDYFRANILSIGRTVNSAVSSDGKTAVIAYSSSETVTNIRVLVKGVDSEWSLQSSINVNTGVSRYCSSVSLSRNGDRIAIGFSVAANQTQSSVVYLYQREIGSLVLKKSILSPRQGRTTGDAPFCSLSQDGKTLAIGDAYGDVVAEGNVRVYEEEGSDFVLKATIQANDTSVIASSMFGFSVDMDGEGTSMIVGAPNAASGQGLCFIFKKEAGAWVKKAKLLPDAGALLFGKSVSMTSAGTVVGAGARRSIGNSNHRPTQYLFTKTSDSVWDKKSYSYSADSVDYLASAVALCKDGSGVAMGLPGYDGGSFPGFGQVLIFS